MEFGNVKKIIRNQPDNIVLLLIAISSFWVSSNVNWGKQRPQHIVKADGKGYYAHLPAIFIYQDLNFGFFDSLEGKKYYQEPLYYEYRKWVDGKAYNKYFIGTAVCMAPFFFIAHTQSALLSLPTDGYAHLYPIWINIGAIFYLVISLFFCGKLLERFGIVAKNRALVYLIFYFGTNWFYWTNFEPGVSHVYSAAILPMFYYFYLKFSDSKKSAYLYATSFLLGLAILIRPVNMIALFALPLFFNSFKAFIYSLKDIFTKPMLWGVSLPLMFTVIAIQPLIYFIQTGHYVIDSYTGERFYFNQPHMFDFLFSYKKGLFVYTPVLLFSVFGLLKMRSLRRFFTLYWMLFFVVFVYILSSWHCWWYGGGFGTRVMIEYYVLWMIPMAYLIQSSAKKIRFASISVLTILVLYCQFQTFQYRYNLIYWDGISKEEYWDIFLKLWF